MTSQANDTAPWWYSFDDERFQGPFDTREAAIAEGEDYYDPDGFYICQATQSATLRLADFIEVDDLIERANDCAYDLGDPDGSPLFDPKTEDTKDLLITLRAAVNEWQDRRGIVFKPWAFTWQGRSEWVGVKKDDEE